MSLLHPTRFFSQRLALVARPARRQLAPSFSTSASRFAGKESDVHNEKRAEEAEAAKQDQLQHAQKTGQGKKKNELASDSEEAIMADRGENKDKGPEELMKETEDKPAEKHGQQ